MTRRKILLTQLVVALAVVVFLQFAPQLGLVGPLALVPLSDMIGTLGQMLGTAQLWSNVGATGVTILLSVVLAAVTGVLGGHVLWRSPHLRRAVEPYLTSYYALPVFAFYPVLVAVFGLNRTPVVLLAWAYATVAAISGTLAGLDAVPRVFMRTAQVYRLPRWETLWRVQLPAAAPHVFTGLRLSVTYAVIGVIASEFILATRGLGWLVSYTYNSFALAQMYATILFVMVLAVLITGAVSLVEKLAFRGAGATR